MAWYDVHTVNILTKEMKMTNISLAKTLASNDIGGPVVGYMRVSTNGQKDDGTIEDQDRQLRPIGSMYNVREDDWFTDDGKSAGTGKLGGRTDWHRLVERIKAGRVKGIICQKIDRLTRTEDLVERAEILGTLQRHGVKIITPGGVIDLNTFTGDLLVGNLAALAAYERKNILDRTQGGKARLLAQGGKPHGMPPYGLRYDRKAGWTVAEHEAEIIREVVRRVTARESCDRIAVDLTKRGIAAPGKRWSHSIVLSLVRFARFRYLGRWRANQVRDIWVEIPNCRILSESELERAEAALLANRRGGLGHRVKHVYALDRRVVRCGGCGGWMGVRGQAGKTYYLCRSQRLPLGSPGRCDARGANVRTLDTLVWDALLSMLDDRELVKRTLRSIRDSSTGSQATALDALEKARARVADIERKAKAITGRLDALDADSIGVVLDKLAADKKAAALDLKDAEEAARDVAVTDIAPRDLTEALARFRAHAAKATPEEKRTIIRASLANATLTTARELVGEVRLPVAYPDVNSSSTSQNRVRLGSLRIPLGRRPVPVPVQGERGRFRGSKRAA